MNRLIVAIVLLLVLAGCDDGTERMRTVVGVKASNSMTLQMGEPTQCEVRHPTPIAGGWLTILACETSLATVTAEMNVIVEGDDYLWSTDNSTIRVTEK